MQIFRWSWTALGPHHRTVKEETAQDLRARPTSRVAALINDLKSRGLLDSTIVLWAGEFGRLPDSAQELRSGRDHNRNAFSLWLAGGGFKNGLVYGRNRRFRLQGRGQPRQPADLHATLFHQLGLDHDRLTFPHEGREETPTNVSVTNAQIVGDILKKPPKEA